MTECHKRYDVATYLFIEKNCVRVEFKVQNTPLQYGVYYFSTVSFFTQNMDMMLSIEIHAVIFTHFCFVCLLFDRGKKKNMKISNVRRFLTRAQIETITNSICNESSRLCDFIHFRDFQLSVHFITYMYNV